MSAMLFFPILCMTGCQKEQETLPPAVFEISEDTVIINSDGGEAHVVWSVRNPEQGVLPEPVTEASWIQNLTASEAVVSFNVEPNEAETGRTAVVDLAYGDLSASFTVIQEGIPAPFDITVNMVRAVSVQFDIAPDDESMTYLYKVVEKADADKYPDNDALFAWQMEELRISAEAAGLTFESGLRRSLRSGPKECFINDIAYGTEHCILVYGCDEQGNRLSPVLRCPITTIAPETADNTEFDIDFTVVDNKVTMNVTPSDPEQLYYCSFDVRKFVSEETALQQAMGLIDAYISMFIREGYSVEEIVAATTAKKGNFTETVEFGWPNEPGLGYAFAINEEGIAISELSFGEFTVGEPPLSDNDIELSVTDIEARSANINVTASNEDPYVLFYDKAAAYEGLSDDEIIESILSLGLIEVSNRTRYSDVTEPMTGLTRETEYIVCAFGYNGGIATTGLTKTTFTTAPAVVSDAECILEVENYFDGDEVSQVYSQYSWAGGMVVIPAKAVPNSSAVKYYYHIWAEEYADPEKVHDDEIIAFLSLGGMQTPQQVFFTNWDEPRTIVAVAVDAEGNYGPVYRKAITFTKDEAAPVEEFPEEFLNN